MNTLWVICVTLFISTSLSKPLSNLDYRGTDVVQVLPVKTCTDLLAAGHDVKITTPYSGDMNYAMCILKGPFKTSVQERRSYDRPNVESGPGVFKEHVYSFDPKMIEKKFKYIIEKKQKEEEEKKMKNMLQNQDGS